MGFKQREKKRKAKAAQGAAQSKARRDGSSKGGRWLTPVSRDTCCADCSTMLRAGRHTMVYRHTPREALCVACANRRRIAYRPSLAWEAQHPDAKVRRRAVAVLRTRKLAGHEGRRPEPQSRPIIIDAPAENVVPLSPSTRVQADRKAA